MNVLDLFSGIGGFSLGLERAGMRTVAFCERDEFCRAVLAKHWPGIHCYDDVRAIPRIGGIDLVCGGFPCQPWSSAGKQLGAEDDRHLWPAMLEVIKAERPYWVVGENVAGIIRLGLDQVLSDLEGIGYACRTFDIPACAIGADHIRRRVWIVARDTHRNSQSTSAVNDEAQRLSGLAADSYSAQCEGRGISSGVHAEYPDFGDPRWREDQSSMDRTANGIPRQLDRLRAIGNAVVPQIPEIIGRAIMKAHHAR